MPKITFMGAGSTVFAKNVLGDSMMTPALENSTIALYDIDGQRLNESKLMLETINRNNGSKAKIEAYLGVEQRKDALRGANYVVNAIQVGGYEPCTVIDFEVPKRYGLRQTIADTLGIGGIFRALRTIPVMLDFARDMEEVCPDALFLNYTNPMAMLSGAMQRATGIKTVGLCHSVQACCESLLRELNMVGGPGINGVPSHDGQVRVLDEPVGRGRTGGNIGFILGGIGVVRQDHVLVLVGCAEAGNGKFAVQNPVAAVLVRPWLNADAGNQKPHGAEVILGDAGNIGNLADGDGKFHGFRFGAVLLRLVEDMQGKVRLADDLVGNKLNVRRDRSAGVSQQGAERRLGSAQLQILIDHKGLGAGFSGGRTWKSAGDGTACRRRCLR